MLLHLLRQVFTRPSLPLVAQERTSCNLQHLHLSPRHLFSCINKLIHYTFIQWRHTCPSLSLSLSHLCVSSYELGGTSLWETLGCRCYSGCGWTRSPPRLSAPGLCQPADGLCGFHPENRNTQNLFYFIPPLFLLNKTKQKKKHKLNQHLNTFAPFSTAAISRSRA